MQKIGGNPHQFDIPLPGSIQSKVYLGKMMCFHGEFSTSMLVKTGVIAAYTGHKMLAA